MVHSIRRLHEELSALARAGVTTAATPDCSAAQADRVLVQLTSVAESIDRESADDIPSFAQRMRQLPEPYAALLQTGNRCGRLSLAIERVGDDRGPATVSTSAQSLPRSYAWFLVAFAFLLFIFFCNSVVPELATLLDDSQVERPFLIQLLMTLHRTTTIWVPLAGLLVALAWLATLRRNTRRQRPAALNRWWQRVTGAEAVERLRQRAAFAKLILLCDEHQITREESLELALAAFPLARCDPRAARNAESDREKHAPHDLLQWGLSQPLDLRSPREHSALAEVAATYSAWYGARERSRQRFIPLAWSLAIGGGAVLLYGLVLFIPVVHILSHIR